MPVSTAVDVSDLSDAIKGILDGQQWIIGADNFVLTYSFADHVTDFEAYTWRPSNYDVREITPLSASEMGDVRAALAHIESFTQLRFEEVSDSAASYGTLRYAYGDELPENFAGVGFTPGENLLDGDVWFSRNIDPYDWFELVLHETGHALGLQHPHDGMQTLASSLDGEEWTVMSYNVSVDYEDATDADLFPQTFMWLDIQALQAMYGINTHASSGSNVYVFDDANRYYLTIWDSGGLDALDLSSLQSDVQIDLTPGSWQNVGTIIQYFDDNGNVVGEKSETVYIADDTTIEWLLSGGGSDQLTGNDTANKISGGAGDDVIDGGEGNDTLLGGEGDDSISDAGGESWIWASTGNDLVAVSADSAAIIGGSEGDDTLTGGGGDDTLYGSLGDDSVAGGGGSDLLFGGNGADMVSGGAGDDTLWGGAGDDTLTGGEGADSFYFVDKIGDKVITDFSVAQGDMLYFTMFDSLEAMLTAATSQVIAGEDATLIEWGADQSVLLLGVSLEEFSAIASDQIILTN